MIDDYHLQNLTTSSFINMSTGHGELHGLAPYRSTRTPLALIETKFSTYLDLSVYHYRLKKEMTTQFLATIPK